MPMLPQKLAALYGQMEEVREETLSALSGRTEEEFSRRPGVAVVRRADPSPPPDGGDRDKQGDPEVDQGFGGGTSAVPGGRFRS